MDTNVHEESTEYTEENASQTSAIILKFLWEKGDSWGRRICRPPSARRFVTLRASANDVMRKLEVLSLSVQTV